MRSGIAMRVLGGWLLASAALWAALPAAAQSIVVAVDPGTDFENEDFDGVDEFSGEIFVRADTLEDAFTILRDNPAIGEMWIVRKDGCGAWDEVFPTLGGASEDAINSLTILGFPFDEPWRTIIAPSGNGAGNGAVIRIESVAATNILIEGITVEGGEPAVLITTPEDADDAGTVVLDRCIIRDASGDGIEVAGVASAQIYNTAVYLNARDGVYVGSDATAELEYVSILRNADHGLFADGEAEFEPFPFEPLEPTDDTFIDEDQPATNFGGEAELRVRAAGERPGDAFRTEAVLTFAPANLTGVLAIEGASLVLHDTRADGEIPDEGVTRVFGTLPPEFPPSCASCLTWDNAPPRGPFQDEALYDQTGATYTFDVSEAFAIECADIPCDLDRRVSLRVGHFYADDSNFGGEPPLYASSDTADLALQPSVMLTVTLEDATVQTVVLPIDTAVPEPEDEPLDCDCALEPAQLFAGDTIIREETPSEPSGAEAAVAFALVAFGGELDTAGERDALLRFEVEGLPPGKPQSVTLTMTALEFPEGTTVTLFGAANAQFQGDVEDWNEIDLAWDDENVPVSVRNLAEHTFAADVFPDEPETVTFDVTRWVQGNGVVYFRIQSDREQVEGIEQYFSSKESDFAPILEIVWEADTDPVEEPSVTINNSLVWDNGDGAFFEGKPGLIQQGSEPFDGEDDETTTMHVDDFGEIFDREPAITAANPEVVLNSPTCSENFPGRILEEDSPLIGRGIGLPAGFNVDLDFDIRPSDGSDIGVDQLASVSAGPITWYFSAVTPPPGCFDSQGVVGDPVGEVAAGDLRVEVRVRAEAEVDSSAPDAVFILPQDHMRHLVAGPLEAVFVDGVLTDVFSATGIRLEVIALTRQAVVSGLSSVWIGTNTNDITTRLLIGPDNPGAAFNAADTFADGHAIVCLAYNPFRDGSPAQAEPDFNVVGDQGPLAAGIQTLDEDGAIIDQALIGRHVLIDTIPPQFDFRAVGDFPTAEQFIAQPDFPNGSNDRLLPNMLPQMAANFGTHPFPPPPATAAGIAGVWPTALETVPSDQGALVDSSDFPPVAGIGGNLFFNHASLSNRSGPAGPDPDDEPNGGIPGTYYYNNPLAAELNALRARLAVSFIDPTLEEYHGIIYDALNPPPFNPFTNSAARPVAGFRETLLSPFNTSFPTTVGDLLAENVDDLFPLNWGYAPDSRRFVEDALVQVNYGVSARDALEPDGTPGAVLDFAAIRLGEFATSPFHRDAAIVGDWHFTPELDPAPGIDYLGSIGFEEHISNSHFVARLLFRGRDAACNTTPTQLNQRTMGPLNLWWIVSTDTRMTRHTDGDEIELGEASFNWELARGYSPRSFGQPQPLFIWRVYGATTDDINGPYVPLTLWQNQLTNWRQARAGLPSVTAEEFEELTRTNPNAFFGRWLMIVAIGADEAGNVTQFPWQDWAGNPNIEVAPIGGQRERANWLRVRINREQTARATLTGQFWWKPYLIGVQERPPEGATVYRGVVPLPPRPGPGFTFPPGAPFDQAVYAKFTIEVSGLTEFNYNPPGDQLHVLFDLRRRGSDQRLAIGGNAPEFGGYGVNVRVNPGVRRLHVFLPLGDAGGSGGTVRTEDGVTIGAFTFNDPGIRFTWPVGEGGPSVLGDQTRQTAVDYVARSAIWIARPDDDGNVPTTPASDREIQASPSNLRFTVVPDATRAQFFRPRYSPDDQPIRLREQQ